MFALPVLQRGQWLVWQRGQIAALLVGLTMTLYSLVSSEPAPSDALMLGLIIALPLLGCCRPGPWAGLNLAIWIIFFACSLIAAGMAEEIWLPIKHQLITLFLVFGAFVMAGYVRHDPVRRCEMILACYTAGVTFACLLAIIGHLDLIPGTYDIFTRYGRGRGTFKDPNVLGAAIVPALAYLTWLAMRQRVTRVKLLMAVGGVLALGLLVSFSRGAWMAAFLVVVLVTSIAAVTGRRKVDRQRLAIMIACGSAGFVAMLMFALQFDAVSKLLVERATLSQSYDSGPDGRFGGQAKAVDLILDNPLGIGAKVFSEIHHHEAPHQVYLSMFLTAGWIGGLLFLLSTLITVCIIFRGALSPGACQGPMLVIWASFFAMVVEGLIIDTDHWRHLFLLMGLSWGLADSHRHQTAASGLSLSDDPHVERRGQG